MADPTKDELLKLLASPELSNEAKFEVLDQLAPELSTLSPQAKDKLLHSWQIEETIKPPLGVEKPRPVPVTPFHPGQILDTVVGGGATLAQGAQELLTAPGELAVAGLNKLGVDTETPRPPLFSVPQPATKDYLIPPMAPLSEQVPGLVDLTMPFAGMKAASGLVGRGVEKLFGRDLPRIPPIYDIPPGDPSFTRTPAQGAMQEQIMGERVPTPTYGPSPIVPPAEGWPTSVDAGHPYEDLLALSKQYNPLEPPGKRGPVHDAAAAKALGLPQDEAPGLMGNVPSVSYEEAKVVETAITDASKLKSPVKDVEPAGVEVGKDGSIEVMPGRLTRAFSPGLDVIGKTGPRGQILKDKLWAFMDKVERDASHLIMNTDQSFARILGRRSWLGQKQARSFMPWKDYSMEHTYNIEKDDVMQLVDHLYTGGTAELTGPNAGKLKELADAFFENTRTVSSHPGIREFTIPDPYSEGGKRAYGSPDMFFPHKPIDPEKILELKDLRVKQLWEVAQKRHGYQGTLLEYKAQLNKFAQRREEEITAGRHGWVGKRRGFNAAELGRPSEILEVLGYDTDPLRVLFAFDTSGLRSGEGKLIEGTVNNLVTEIKERIKVSSKNRNEGQWVEQLTRRVLGNEPMEIVDREARNILTNIRHWNDVTLLQMAALPQFNQMTYIVGRAGLADTMGAALRTLRTHELQGMPERSGAMFTNMMNELTVPATTSGRMGTAAMRGSLFTAADNEMRQFGAVVGGHHAEKIAKLLVAHPQDQRLRGILTELRVDPEDVIRQGGLTRANREIAAQNFANMTSGRTDVRTLPLWLTSENPVAQMLYQYKKFLFNNLSDLKRQVLDAPVPYTTKAARATRILGTAGVMGEISRELQIAVSNFDNPLDVPGEKRIAAPLRTLYKESPAAAYLVDRTLAGMGSVMGLLIYSAIETKANALYETILGPTPGLGIDLLVDTNQAVQGTLQDKATPTKPLAKAVARRVPIVGPLTPSFVDNAYREPFKGVRTIKGLEPYSPLGDFGE